jgi:hypothetical protein
MAFYRNKVNKVNLLDTLVQKLTSIPAGATVPYWTQVQSGTYAQEGYILHSKGSSGTDDVYVRMTSNTQGIVMSMIEQYTPNPISGLVGTVVNESYKQNVQVATSTYSDTAPVQYVLSFDKDKIILVIKGNLVSNGGANQTMAYIGLPERLDPTDNSTAAVFAVSRSAYLLTDLPSNSDTSSGKCKVLRARNKETQSIMYMIRLGAFKTKGWNDTLLLSHIYLQDDISTEGVRSRMSSIHPIYQNASNPDFRDGDEITVGSKRYLVLQIWEVSTGSGTNCFPTGLMAIEEL